MKIHLIISLLLFIFLASNTVFGQETNSGITSIPQSIGNFIGGASPFIIIGFGILLIFIQKLAKYIGIILLVVGMIRLVLLFIH
ncbi:hypothetical protein B188_07690 [Candidatus Brocadiaceae bacterium B188]|nr:hypothetical protein [Candidatus Brocadia sapporoensis]OQZ05049.1 MAG: hypothetical protein B6D34_00410 [Candidatus Brocadia sp. UTAMX1]QQR67952.1 MAG: hypothetical protein IPI25_07165 [Candidatus Brocadia sp.]RZV58058.1 MAG: hypothetical protein EX330_07315 [Candidatus Brocadia sp. BROELEC01]TWU52810.1 hypothetical protein B188_07690 [Candidatus Brocadiaceae bacterium B188]